MKVMQNADYNIHDRLVSLKEFWWNERV